MQRKFQDGDDVAHKTDKGHRMAVRSVEIGKTLGITRKQAARIMAEEGRKKAT